MLTVFILDSTAEERSSLVGHIASLLAGEEKDQFLVPRLNIKPISKQELKFHAAPDILIIGDGIVTRELSEIGSIRKMLPDSALLVKTTIELENLSSFEQIARMGADDTFSEATTSLEFFRKLILLSRKASKKKSGTLVVIESGKGGLGVTSLVAGLGESIASSGKRVALLDFDSDTQDLSRFLQARPFVNENLQLLLDQERPITEESVQQCMVRIWDESDDFVCMPPVAECDALYDPHSLHSRIMLSLLEVLDHLYDCVIVDVGSARGSILRTFYRVADKVVFVTANDPASLYASFEKISRVKSSMSANGELLLVEYAKEKMALSSALLRQEISFHAKVDSHHWIKRTLPHCTRSGRWPASGGTLFSSHNKALVSAINEIGVRLGFFEPEGALRSESHYGSILGRLKDRLIRLKGGPAANSMLPSPARDEQVVEVREGSLELPAPDEFISPPRLEVDGEADISKLQLHSNATLQRDLSPSSSSYATQKAGESIGEIPIEKLVSGARLG